MQMQDDISFWRDRAEQTRAMADRAITPAIRQLHLDRAELYATQMRNDEPAINRSDIRSV